MPCRGGHCRGACHIFVGLCVCIILAVWSVDLAAEAIGENVDLVVRRCVIESLSSESTIFGPEVKYSVLYWSNASVSEKNSTVTILADSNLRSVGDELTCAFLPTSNVFFSFLPDDVVPLSVIESCLIVSISALAILPNLLAVIASFASASVAPANGRLRSNLQCVEMVAVIFLCFLVIVGGLAILVWYLAQVFQMAFMEAFLSKTRCSNWSPPYSPLCTVSSSSCHLLSTTLRLQYVANVTSTNSTPSWSLQNVTSDPITYSSSYSPPCLDVSNHVHCIIDPTHVTQATLLAPAYFRSQLNSTILFNGILYSCLCLGLVLLGAACCACEICRQMKEGMDFVRSALRSILTGEYMRIQDDNET